MLFYHWVGIIAIYGSKSSYWSGSQAAHNLDRCHFLLCFFHFKDTLQGFQRLENGSNTILQLTGSHSSGRRSREFKAREAVKRLSSLHHRLSPDGVVQY